MVDEGVSQRPAAPLRGLIAEYSGYLQRGVEPALHRGLPSPHLTFIVTLYEPLRIVEQVDGSPAQDYDALIGGLHARPATVAHGGAQSGIQLRVSPLASRALFGLPAGELAGTDGAADAILGWRATELQERLAEAPSFQQRFSILDNALSVSDTRPPAPVCNAWWLLMRSGGAIPVSTLADQVGWSERQLHKRFSQEIGLSPKLAAQVIRFDRARHALGTQTLAAVAAQHGYADQSHLVRAFKRFAGATPKEFRNVQDDSAAAA